MVSDKPPEDLLAMARRHVVEGELRVTRQEACIAKLTRDGHHAAAARGTEVLKQMRWSLDLGRRHLAFELAQQARRQSAISSPLLCRGTRNQSVIACPTPSNLNKTRQASKTSF